MITYNEVKELLNVGLFPCIIYKNFDGEGTNEIDYIKSYSQDRYGGCECTSINGMSYQGGISSDELEVN